MTAKRKAKPTSSLGQRMIAAEGQGISQRATDNLSPWLDEDPRDDEMIEALEAFDQRGKPRDEAEMIARKAAMIARLDAIAARIDSHDDRAANRGGPLSPISAQGFRYLITFLERHRLTRPIRRRDGAHVPSYERPHAEKSTHRAAALVRWKQEEVDRRTGQGPTRAEAIAAVSAMRGAPTPDTIRAHLDGKRGGTRRLDAKQRRKQSKRGP